MGVAHMRDREVFVGWRVVLIRVGPLGGVKRIPQGRVYQVRQAADDLLDILKTHCPAAENERYEVVSSP